MLSIFMNKQSRIEKAQSAYRRRDVKASRLAHTKNIIAEHNEEHTKDKGKYVGDVVFGALDGIVTTFAIVSGVQGANLPSSIVLILGFANLFGDGLSMGFGNYLSIKSEIDYIKRERRRELWEIEHVPEGEKEEVRQIYAKKGFKGKDLDRVVDVITSDKNVWLDTMMYEELGLLHEDKTPAKSGLATFLAFCAAGFIPLITFVLAMLFPWYIFDTFVVSAMLTGLALYTVGAMRSWVTGIHWHNSGMQMLVVGGIAAIVAYAIGYLLRGIVA
jgi:vacuolar iron transporter family protein